MKKFLDFLIRMIREGVPMAKSVAELFILASPFIRRARGYCPLCHTTLWEQMPADPVDVMQKHLKICPKSKENGASK